MYLSSAGRVQRTSVDTALDVLATAESTLAFAAASTPVPSLSSTDTASITAADSTSNEDDTIKSSTNTAAKEPIYADPRQIKEDAMVPILLQRAKTGLEACEGFTTRLDIYAEAAERGSAEALYKWAMLVKQGSEVSNTACGVSSSSTSEGEGGQGAAALSGTASALWGSKPTDKSVAFEHERAVQALLVAADMGHSAALVPLSFALLNGLGAEPMLRGNTSVSSAWNIPLHPSYIAEEGPRGCYRPVQLQRAISDYLLSGELGCGDRNGADSLAGNPAALANSVLRVRHQNASAAGIGSTESISGNQEGEEGLRELRKKGKRCPDPTSLAVGLLHVAALHEIPEAHQALAYRYIHTVIKS